MIAAGGHRPASLPEPLPHLGRTQPKLLNNGMQSVSLSRTLCVLRHVESIFSPSCDAATQYNPCTRHVTPRAKDCAQVRIITTDKCRRFRCIIPVSPLVVPFELALRLVQQVSTGPQGHKNTPHPAIVECHQLSADIQFHHLLQHVLTSVGRHQAVCTCPCVQHVC